MEQEFKKHEVVWCQKGDGPGRRAYYVGISLPLVKDTWHHVYVIKGCVSETQYVEKYKNQDNISCSHCIKCGEMVLAYEKYCPTCIDKYNLRLKQDENFHKTFQSDNYKADCERIFLEDTTPDKVLAHNKASMKLAFEVGDRSSDFEKWYYETFKDQLTDKNL